MSEPTSSGLRERLQIFRRDMTHEAEGGHVATLVPVGTVWARVTPIGARAANDSDAQVAEASHTVVIRHRAGIVPGDRFGYRGRSLEVLSTEDLTGRHKFLACRCIERRVTA